MASRTIIPRASARAKPAYLDRDCYAHRCYSISRSSVSSGEKHFHDIVLKGDSLTVDGNDYGKIDDPQNASFMESLLNYDLPDEFNGEGLHVVEIRRLPDFGSTTPKEWMLKPGELGPMVNADSESDGDVDVDFDVIFFDSESDSD